MGNDIKLRARELLAEAASGCSALPIRNAPHLDKYATVSVDAALRAIEAALSPREGMVEDITDEQG